MSASPSEAQILSQLNQVLDQTREIRAKVGTGELLEILQVLRDQVNRLSREHESIRQDLRDIRNNLATSD